MKMLYSIGLKKELEKWWKHLDKPMSLMENDNDIEIGSFIFRPLGEKLLYHMKTKCTDTYMRSFQSTVQVENIKGEIIYPILDVYIDICHGKKRTTYKKVRSHCYC